MTDVMNMAEVSLMFENGQKLSKQFTFSNTQLIINDTLILSILQDASPSNVATCHICLGANNIAVNIENYTITNTIYFKAFYNLPSNISIFQSKETSVDIVNYKVDQMQLDCPSFLLVDCQIRQLDIGFIEHHKALMKCSENNNNTFLTAYKMKSIDIRECHISSIRAYIECDNIDVRGCTIDKFNLHGSFGSKVIAEVRTLNIWEYSTIGMTEINCKISNFIIKESTISNVVAQAHCIIDKLRTDDSVVLNAHNFEKRHFYHLDYNKWMFISKSAGNDRNLSIKAEANFQMAKENYKKERGVNKVIGKLFEFCTGYGYKPIKAWFFCVILIVASFLILTIKDFIFYGFEAINNLLNNATISVAALAGQSGLKITDGFGFWIGTVEYIGGIITFAMFVNALYVRYKD